MTTYVNEFLNQNGTCTYDTDSDSVDTPLDPDVLLLVIEKTIRMEKNLQTNIRRVHCWKELI